MKKSAFTIVGFLCLLMFLQSFKTIDTTTSNPPDEFEILVKHLETSLDYLNSTDGTAIVSAKEVFENIKNKRYLVIDLRRDDYFDDGHIKGSKNIKAANLLKFFKSKVTPEKYDKVIITCYSGQSAGYYASLLRMYGFKNAYSMNWGMSSWGKAYAERMWTRRSTDDFKNEVETTNNAKSELGARPTLSTGKTTATDILKARIEHLFTVPYKSYIVKAPALFEARNDFYLINYWNKENYDEIHIKGAVHYTPASSLTSTTDLYTLPLDKKIVMYDGTGQKAAYAVAYLNVLGYEVSNLGYGANRVMNSTLIEKGEGWDAFSAKEIHDYPVKKNLYSE